MARLVLLQENLDNFPVYQINCFTSISAPGLLNAPPLTMQKKLPTSNQSGSKKCRPERSHAMPHFAKTLLLMLLPQVQTDFSSTYLSVKKSGNSKLRFGLVATILMFLSISNLQAQPTNARPFIKYLINNYASISTAACDTCPLIAGKPLIKNRPIPFPPAALANALPIGVDINTIPGLCAPNFMGGGSPEIKGLVKTVAGMTDVYAQNLRRGEVLYFKDGAKGVAVSSSGKIYTSSLTVPLGPIQDPPNVNGFFTFKSSPERLPKFNSTSNATFEPSPRETAVGNDDSPQPTKKIAYFSIDPENENIVYASFTRSDRKQEMARKNPSNGQWEIFRMPFGLGESIWGATAVDHNGHLYIADSSHHVVVEVTFYSNGQLKTWQIIGGKLNTPGFVNDDDGEDARFNKPSGVCVDEDGNVYVGDYGNNVVRKIDEDGEVTTYAGSGTAGSRDDDSRYEARFNGPKALAYNETTRSLYVIDYNNKTIREIDNNGKVTTLAGTAGSLNPISNPLEFANNVYYLLAKLNMDPDEAKFSNPTGIAMDPSGLGLYVSDGNYIKYVNVFPAVFTITAAVGDPRANEGPLKILPYGIFMNKNNGSFSGVPITNWAPTTYAISVLNSNGLSLLNGAITFEVVSCPTIVDTVAVNKTISPRELPYTWNGKTFNSAGQAYLTLRNTQGCDSVVVLNLLVKPEFNYNAEPYILSLGQQITPIVPITAGSPVVNYSISPALPTGLSLNAQTGVISGTPLTYATSQLTPAIGPQTPVSYPAPWTLKAYSGADITQFKITDGNQRSVFENNSAFGSLQGSAGPGTGTAGAYTNFSGLGAIKMSSNTPYSVRLSNTLTGQYGYPLSQTYGSYNFMNSYAVYIDYNRDGDFDDASERVYISGSPQSEAHAEVFNLNIPGTATAGVTKMRIYCVEASTRPSVYYFNYGINGPFTTVRRTTDQALSFYPFFNNISTSGQLDFATYSLDYGEFEDYNIEIINPQTQAYTITGTNTVGTAQSTIRLAVNNPTTSTTDTTICSTALPYSWNGLTFSQAGTQTAHLRNIYGADSAATLNLTVKQATSSVIAVANCGPYTYQGTVYTTSGDYPVHVTNVAGCDSAIIFRFRQKATASVTNLDIIPSQLPYTWNGLTFTTAGTRSAHPTNAEGCDSSATLVLRVRYNLYYPVLNLLPVNNPITPLTPVIEGSYVPGPTHGVYDGFTISPALPNGLQINVITGIISGTPTQLSPLQTYTVTLNQDGAKPSIFQLAVGIPSTSTTTISNCGPYTWNGVLYTTPTTVSVPLKNQYGFDSTATLILSIRNPSTSATSLLANQSELPIVWNGVNLIQEGDKTISLVNAAGCDSAATVTVAVNPKVSYQTPNILLANQPILPISPQSTGGEIPTVLGNVSTFIKADYLSPGSVALDAQGNTYVSDELHKIIYKINRRGIVSAVSGFGATQALLAIDKRGYIYAADRFSNRIIKRDTTGMITVLASASSPNGIAVDNAGNVYFSEGQYHRIRKISSTGIVSTLAGGTTAGYANGNATTARFNTPSGLSVDSLGNVYVADLLNNRIRKITPTGDVTSFAGNGTAASVDGTGSSAGFSAPIDIAADSLGNKYVVDKGSSKVRKINAAGMVSTLAGTTAGYQDGAGSQARFNLPTGLTTDSHGQIYVADKNNAAIRQVNAINYTIQPALVNGLQFNEATGIISGTPADTLLQPVTYTIRAFNKAGADSFKTVIGICNPRATSFTINTCDKYVWNDSTYTISTTHTRTLKSKGGCDSVVTMRLTIRKSSTGLTTTVTACGSYVWKGTTYNQTGLYTKVYYPNAVGCDSTIYLNLTIKPVTINNLFVDINPMQLPYTWRGKIFTAPGKDSITLANANSVGCDSIITMTVRISTLIPNISYVTRDTVLYWNRKIAAPITMTNTGAPIPQTKIGEMDTLIRFSNNGPGDFLRHTIKGLDGAYYTAESNSSQIFKLSTSGVWTAFASPGGIVTAMTVDRFGNLYIGIDVIPSQIRKITPAGVVSILSGSPFFYGINAMAIDADNSLVIVNQELNNVLKMTKFNLSTSQSVQTQFDYGPYLSLGDLGMKADSKGNMYVYTNPGTSIMKIKPNGQVSGIGQIGTPYDLFTPGNGTDAVIPQITSMAIDTTNDNVYLMAFRRLIRVDTAQNVSALTNKWFDQYKDQIFRLENGKIAVINNSTRVLFTANVYGVGSIPFMDNYGGGGVSTNYGKPNFKEFDNRIRLDSTGAIVGTPRAEFNPQTGTVYGSNTSTAYSIVAANQYGIGNFPMVITNKYITYTDQTFVTTSFPYIWKGKSFNAATDTATYFATNRTSANDTLYTLHLIYDAPEPVITATGNCAAGNITLTANGPAKNAISFDGSNVASIKHTQNGIGLSYVNPNYYLKPNNTYGANHSMACEVWIKPTSVTGTQYILAKDTVPSHAAFIGFSIQNQKLVYEFTKGTTSSVQYKVTSNASIVPNIWTHVAASYYDSALHIFINGQLDRTLQTPNSDFPGFYTDPVTGASLFQNFYLGGLGRQFGFKGEMDEFRAWSTVRTAAAIQATKNFLVAPLSTGLALYYRFDGSVSDSALDISLSHRWARLIQPATSVSPSTIPISFTTYQWTPGYASTSSITVNPTSNTVYTLKVEDYKGSTASTSLLVSTRVSNTTETIRVCGSSYVWHGTTYNASTNTPTWRGVNQYGCDSNVTLNLTLLPLPTPVIAGPNRICIGGTATLSAAGYSSYVWLPGGETTAGITVQPTITSTYSLKVTNTNGCQATISKTIGVGGPSSSTERISACASYTWHGTTYTSSNNTATWVGVNAAGCDSVVTLNLHIDPLPAPSIVSATGETICSGSPLQITARASGSQLNLDGNSRVAIDAMGVNPATGFTLEGWVNFASIGTQQSIISQTVGNTPLPFDAWLNANGTVSFAVGNGTNTSTITTTATMTAKTWRHVAFVYNTQTISIYIDGVSSASGTAALPIVGRLNNFMIGNNESLSRPMVGAVDEIRVWNVALSQAQIAGNKNLSVKPDSYGLAAYYTFDEEDSDLPTNTANTAISATIIGEARHSISTAPITYQSYNWTGGITSPVITAANTSTLYTVAVVDANGCTASGSGKAVVSTPSTFTEVVNACGPYTWHGITYTSSNNTAQWTTRNVAGCDSVVTLNLTIGLPSTSIETAIACNYFIWHGTTYTTSTNAATWRTINAAGCDSVVTLNLTIRKAVERTDTVITCGTYSWHGSNYTASTKAPIWYGTSQNGCDSIVHLNLVIANLPVAKINATNKVTTDVCQAGIVLRNANTAFTKYATGVIGFSSEMANNQNRQIIGVPNTYPNYGEFATAWSTKDDQLRREFIELTYDNAQPINFIDVYETLNSGTIDTVYVKNPATNTFEVVYSGKAELYNTPLQNRISFPLTTYAVSAIRIAINSVDLPAQKSIDAVAIGISNNNSYRWSNGNTGDTLLATQPGNYVLTATNEFGCSVSDTVNVASFDLQQSADSLVIASANRTVSKNVLAGVPTIFEKDCELIASLMPIGGASAANGSVTATVSLLSTTPILASGPFVRRYYDITPVTSRNTATATITLYYTQADFDNYNVNRGNTPFLPLNAADVQGYKANLRINQQHGTSPTGEPGSYTGWGGVGPANLEIAPTSVIYNNTLARWEVVFPVTGFSGFFAHTNTSNILPIKLLSFTASNAGSRNRIDWNTAAEDPGTRFEITRSSNGNSFDRIGVAIGKGQSAAYTFYDEQPINATNYYRLKIMEASGAITFSNVATVWNNGAKSSISIAPIPATNTVTISNTNTALVGTLAIVYDIQGRVIDKFMLSISNQINVAAWSAGIYNLRLVDGTTMRFVKQ